MNDLLPTEASRVMQIHSVDIVSLAQRVLRDHLLSYQTITLTSLLLCLISYSPPDSLPPGTVPFFHFLDSFFSFFSLREGALWKPPPRGQLPKPQLQSTFHRPCHVSPPTAPDLFRCLLASDSVCQKWDSASSPRTVNIPHPLTQVSASTCVSVEPPTFTLFL